ncbi:hypothetical protein [Actinomyces faecalis]|uniref:hypothetical protein n=1 Tax=Actinomyces faecalis TaxID=2722820 RepID=UPI001554E81B|nr:hypothetical protein [Actinomyces faecalis]
MGIEIWALIALVVVLTVYLLPILVGRREVLGHSRVEDRYSSQLRLLAVGPETRSGGETCPESGHAEIFRRRPEVRAMNRPAVRNVRALRAERELVRAKRAHAQARERRRVAATHRSVVACALVGVLLGVGIVAALTVLPWWLTLVPAALVAVSMAAGRRAAVAGRDAERRERRRIAELEAELERLTGHAPAPAAPVAHEERPVLASAVADQAEPDTAPSSFAQPTAERELDVEADEPVAQRAAQTVEATGSDLKRGADLKRPQEMTAPGAQVRAAQRPEEPRKAVEASTQTPPQGWHPVRVPAPTYTLVASAPQRAVEELEVPMAPSAPVPMRPKAVRQIATGEVGEELRQPIDLDAVLQRRRAAGA